MSGPVFFGSPTYYIYVLNIECLTCLELMHSTTKVGNPLLVLVDRALTINDNFFVIGLLWNFVSEYAESVASPVEMYRLQLIGIV